MGLEPPFTGLAVGSAVFLGLLVLGIIVVGFIFRNGQTCYSINFTAILIVMAYIMWACTYMCQMYPLVVPEYTSSES
jgi:flagellar motor component MotA